MTEEATALERQAAVSFDDYVVARGPALVRFAYLLVRDHHLAEDLAQEGLARAHLRWNRIRAVDNPDVYVRKVMVNQLLSWRRRRMWSERPAADLPEETETAGLSVEDRDALWDLIGQLPPRQRVVLVLRFYESLTDDEIAEILACSSATVRSHASKALARLRALLGCANGDQTPLAEGARR